MAASCCAVCYKVGGSSASGTPGEFRGHHDPVTAEAQQRFFKLIQSFSLGQVRADENGKDGDGAAGDEGQQLFPFPLEQFEKFGMLCCGECSKIMRGVCERHHQLETAQLSLNRKLEKLKRIMTGTQGSSTRLGEHLKVTGNEGAGDDRMGAVLESRASLIAICSGKVTCSFSKPNIPRLEFNEETLSVLKTLPGHVGGALVLSENLDLGENGDSDLEEAQPVKRRRCETPRPPIEGGALVSRDGKRKGTNYTHSEDEEEAASTSTDADTGTPRTITRERNNESPPTSSAGVVETAPAELNIIGNANLDPIPVNVACGLRNADTGSTSSPTPVMPQTEDATIDLGDEGSDDSREGETQLELERSIKELLIKEDALQQGDPQLSEGKKQELISKLEVSRQEEADLGRMARRMAWRREVQKEMKSNAVFKEIMEEVPLEDVEVEEKPKMSRMSMEWREAFKSERAAFLFPQVLPTLLKLRLHCDSSRKILNYRLVCKASKVSVDDLLSYDTMGTATFGHHWRIGREKDFMREFSHAANPFFTRDINIRIYPTMRSYRSPEFLPAIEEILRRWGKELWYAGLHVCEGDWSAEFIYDLLVDWLKLMPNLRVLRIYVKGIHRITPDTILAKLREHIAMNPLPNMPHLVHISVRSSKPSPITHAILSKFSGRLEKLDFAFHMDHLQINHTVSNWAPPTSVTAEERFPAMQQLDAYYRYIESVDDVRNIIKNFNNWRLPLRRLELTLVNKSNDGFEPLLLLNNKALAYKGVFLEMPQLEQLTLILSDRMDLRTLDFLLPCKGLKVLILRNIRVETRRKPRRYPQPPDDNGIFQFPTDPADKDRVYQSLIWKLLPELKLIILSSCRVYRNQRKRPATSTHERSICNRERGNE